MRGLSVGSRGPASYNAPRPASENPEFADYMVWQGKEWRAVAYTKPRQSGWSLKVLWLFAAWIGCGGAYSPVGVRAGDWPQILGPDRNGRAHDERLLDAWPETGPRQLWVAKDLGSGFAGPAVVGSQVVVFDRLGDSERVEARDASTGRRLWKTDFPATYRPSINPDDGPRCVPLIDGGKVFVYGAAGDLHCVRLEDGRPLWSRSLLTEFGGDEGYFGAGSTPILAAGKLLVNVGGRERAGLVALDPETGRTQWQATTEQASYASPTWVTIDGSRRVLFVTRLTAMIVDPADGRVVAQRPFGLRGPTVNAATPLVLGDHVFLTASYGIGAVWARLGPSSLETVWANNTSLSSQYDTPVANDGYLFGIHGREDVGRAQLRCISAADGRVHWSVDDFGVAHLIVCGDRLLVLTADGQLALADAAPDAYHERARTRVSTQITRALPALAHGRLFIRDTGEHGGSLMCLEVGDTTAAPQP